LPSEPAGYAASEQGTKGSPAASTKGATSARDINTTSWPRDWSLRANVVMGFRCPDTGRLRKPMRTIPSPISISHILERIEEMSIQKYVNRAVGACRKVPDCHTWIFFSRDAGSKPASGE